MCWAMGLGEGLYILKVARLCGTCENATHQSRLKYSKRDCYAHLTILSRLTRLVLLPENAYFICLGHLFSTSWLRKCHSHWHRQCQFILILTRSPLSHSDVNSPDGYASHKYEISRVSLMTAGPPPCSASKAVSYMWEFVDHADHTSIILYVQINKVVS